MSKLLNVLFGNARKGQWRGAIVLHRTVLFIIATELSCDVPQDHSPILGRKQVEERSSDVRERHRHLQQITQRWCQIADVWLTLPWTNKKTNTVKGGSGTERECTQRPVVTSSIVAPPWFPLRLSPWSPKTNSSVLSGKCETAYCMCWLNWRSAALIAGWEGEDVSVLWALWSTRREWTTRTSAVALPARNDSNTFWIVWESSWYTLNESSTLWVVSNTLPASSLHTGSPVWMILLFTRREK